MSKTPPGNFGSEFYAGDRSVVADACSSGNWDVLRSGELTAAHAIFPACVHSLDVLLLPEVIADITGNAIPQLPNKLVTVAGVEGLWGACVQPRDWLAALASIPVAFARRLQLEWIRVHNRVYEPESELDNTAWMSDDKFNANAALLTLAHIANQQGHDVVEIWKL